MTKPLAGDMHEHVRFDRRLRVLGQDIVHLDHFPSLDEGEH